VTSPENYSLHGTFYVQGERSDISEKAQGHPTDRFGKLSVQKPFKLE